MCKFWEAWGDAYWYHKIQMGGCWRHERRDCAGKPQQNVCNPPQGRSDGQAVAWEASDVYLPAPCLLPCMQADILGIFGAHGVDMAVHWKACDAMPERLSHSE